MGNTSDRFDSEINEIREKIAIEEDKLKDVKSKFDEKANICERLPDNRAREIIEDGMLELSRQINNHKENIQKYEQRIMAILRKEAGRLRSIAGAQTTEKQTTQKTPAKDIKLFHDYYQRILFLNNETYYELTPKEQTLVECLKSGERDIKDICHEMWGNREKRGNFDSLMHVLNEKIKNVFGVGLVGNMEKGEGMYRIDGRITEKVFKK